MNIGIIGRARVGKDTAGAWLVRERGYNRVAFADSLKTAALRVDPIITADEWEDEYNPANHGVEEVRLSKHVEEEGWEGAKAWPECRRFLQELGAAIRTIDPEFWIRAALKRADDLADSTGRPTVITDVRYGNEATTLRARGWHLLYIDRPGIPHLVHESEGALGPEDADHTIMNAGSMADLEAAVQLFHKRVHDAESARHYGRAHD
ncbi:deoxynucleotide monophosphate kinase family protein [Kitasatospora purpeofusca]|uniref:deoxynucleotide monophosphate kinase family protein n=1 Tax=Kitasatospora purpeofusca TaxID=67352 RepID=UPI00369FD147